MSIDRRLLTVCLLGLTAIVRGDELSLSGADAAATAASECDCPACRAQRAADLKAAVNAAYAPLFYNNNFAYLANPA